LFAQHVRYHPHPSLVSIIFPVFQPNTKTSEFLQVMVVSHIFFLSCWRTLVWHTEGWDDHGGFSFEAKKNLTTKRVTAVPGPPLLSATVFRADDPQSGISKNDAGDALHVSWKRSVHQMSDEQIVATNFELAQQRRLVRRPNRCTKLYFGKKSFPCSLIGANSKFVTRREYCWVADSSPTYNGGHEVPIRMK